MPARDSQHIPVDIDDAGVTQGEEDDKQFIDTIDDEAVNEELPKINFDKIHASQKAVRKYVPTSG